jgi:molybdopterin/thiamine biosynthesis adenylyltransferase
LSLSQKKALLVGVGGLGTPAALALAKSGVGFLGLSDSDRVDLSNLHRQILFREGDIGSLKTEAASQRLRTLFPALQIKALPAIKDELLAEILHFDVILDGTDSIETKFLLSDAAKRNHKVLIHAGVVQHRGLITTIKPNGPCYRCFFEEPPPPDEIVTCQEAGILGAAAGFVAGLQAAEALRVLLGQAPLYEGVLLTIDLHSLRLREVRFQKNPRCPVCYP